MAFKLFDLVNHVIWDPLSPCFCQLSLQFGRFALLMTLGFYSSLFHGQWKREGETFSQLSPLLLLSDWLHAYGWGNSNHQSMSRNDQIDQNLLGNQDQISLKRGCLGVDILKSVSFGEENGENGYMLCEQLSLSTIYKSPVFVLLMYYSPNSKKSLLYELY